MYIDNAKFMQEMVNYNKSMIISNSLHIILYTLANRVAMMSCFKRKMMEYHISDPSDMIHNGYLKCVQKINKFNIDGKKNPFSYFTSVVSNSFKDFLFAEKRQEILKSISQKKYEHSFLIKYGFKISKIADRGLDE